MSLIKWDPFREFNTLPARFGGFFGKDWEAPASTTAWNPSVDIFENDNEVVLKAELPGMNAKDIDVSGCRMQPPLKLYEEEVVGQEEFERMNGVAA